MMKATSLLFFLLLCAGPGLVAQNDPLNTSTARQRVANARALCDSNQYLLAEEQAERAYDFFKADPAADSEDLAEAAFQTGRAAFKQMKYGGSRPFFEEAAQLWEKLYPEGSLRTAEALHYTGLCFFYKSKSDNALAACTRAYEIRQKLLPPNHALRAESLRVMGNIYLDMGDYALAKAQYEAALPITESCFGKESSKTADVLSNLGLACLRLGDFPNALAIEEQALQMRQRVLPPFHSDLGDSYINLGTIYKTLRKFDEALFYFDKALELRRKKTSPDLTDIAYVFSEIGQYYLAQHDYAKAQDYFEKENELMIQSKATEESSYAYTCGDLGRLYFQLKNYPKAIEWYEKMVKIRRKSFKNINSPLASMLTRLALARLANEDFDIALAHYQEAKQIWEMLFGAGSSVTAKADAGLANTYQGMYKKTRSETYLGLSRQHYDLYKQGFEKAMQEETSADGQKRTLAEAMPVFERAIQMESQFAQTQTTGTPGNTAPAWPLSEQAWQYTETVHASLLFAATQETNARHFAKIPDSELSRDSLLRTQITALEKKRQGLIQNQGLALTDSLVLAANAQIFAKKDAHKQLRADFEKRYPDYFRLKYNLETVSIEKAQALLSPQQTLLEYFTGDSSIFVFVLQRERSQVVELKRDFPLDEWLRDFREGMVGYHTAATKKPGLYEKTVRQYADVAQKLYAKLLAPLASLLSPELIIVPSESLANLPFEALLTAAPTDPANFRTYPFLLRRYSVHYAYSATMLQQMMAYKLEKAPKGDLLGFAPFFDEDTTGLALRLLRDDATRLGFSALPYSGEEVFRAKKRYGGVSEVFIGQAASKQTFQEKASQYKILHLATHGKANHLAGDFSFLAFASSDDNPENGLVSVGDLYNLSLNADLVLLSACETGIGEQQRGEGVLSLARAFAFAGAKSVVASLWSVNDKSTMQVMDNFYAGIKSGETKSQALTKAKRQYLDQNPGLAAHPFFWASLVGVGDMGKLK